MGGFNYRVDPETDDERLRYSVSALLASHGVKEFDGPVAAVFWAGSSDGEWAEYVEYANGMINPRGAPRALDRSLDSVGKLVDNAVRTFAALLDNRQALGAPMPCAVVWRVRPEFVPEDDGRISWRARCAFVPLCDAEKGMSVDRPDDVPPGWKRAAPVPEAWPSPTPAMLADPLFDAIFQAIKQWDIAVPGAYIGVCSGTGNHARRIYEAVMVQLAVDHIGPDGEPKPGGAQIIARFGRAMREQGGPAGTLPYAPASPVLRQMVEENEKRAADILNRAFLGDGAALTSAAHPQGEPVAEDAGLNPESLVTEPAPPAVAKIMDALAEFQALFAEATITELKPLREFSPSAMDAAAEIAGTDGILICCFNIKPYLHSKYSKLTVRVETPAVLGSDQAWALLSADRKKAVVGMR